MLKIIHSLEELVEWRAKQENKKVGFVPTMGALHAGHATLLKESVQKSDLTVLSIYVNPTQFGHNEDFNTYPKTFDQDTALAQKIGVDVLFQPTTKDIYPSHFSTFVEETRLSQFLCGQFRPGHFRGVATIVLKLFQLVRPHYAFFGLKDAQQFFIIRQMIHDFHLNIELYGIPTVREHSGLAMSSRNQYLSSEQKEVAPLLYKELTKAAAAFQEKQSFAFIQNEFRKQLSLAGFQFQYLECIQLKTLELVDQYLENQPYLLATACFLGTTRLIDNTIINSKLISL